MAIQFRQTIFFGVAAELQQCPAAGMPEIVLSGRSNVGKSSLVNALGENRTLARTSNTPGKTRLIIYFNLDKQAWLVDLPGYGHASVSKAARDKYSGLADQYLGSGRPIALVLFLIDIRHSPSADDHLMLDWLETSGLPYQVVLTKADKLSRSQALTRRFEIARELDLEEPESLLIFSAQSKIGLDDLRLAIEHHIQNWQEKK